MSRYLIIVSLLFSGALSGQKITGTVKSDQNDILIGANVYWLNSSVGVSTNTEGQFEISLPYPNEGKLIASYIGFLSDTIDVKDRSIIDFKLMPKNDIDEIVVRGQRDGIVISNMDPIKTEQITQTELERAACCDLAGCFGTQSTVLPHTTNVITNTRELRILGLSGVYNQVLINGLPMIQALSYTYGISGYPGTIVDNIFISKGANSVLQGFESISGQINVQTKVGNREEKLMLNLYLNSFLEKHINANLTLNKRKWTNLIAFHTVQPSGKFDRDKDDFLDLPLITRYSISNTLKYRDPGEWGWNSKIGARLITEQRIGGQTQFDPNTDLGGTEFYGQSVDFIQPEIWSKTGFRFDDFHNIVLNTSFFHQDQESYFGALKYQARQTNFYTKLQYELNYLSHAIKVGSSFRYLDLNENIVFMDNALMRTFDGNYSRRELIPGIFAENTMKFLGDRLTWIAGIRADHHNTFGLFLTPRTLLKYDFSENAVIRANIGTGWRTANLFSENINLLVSSRDILIEETLEPEQAINYGVNLIQKFDILNTSGYLSFDFYRTDFQNQIFPDYDSDPTKAILRNYRGISISNGFQGELNLKFLEQFDLKLGYNYLDVFRRNAEEKQVLPFNSKHRFLGTFSYRPISNKYHIDFNAHWFGKQRLPNTSSNPVEFQRPDFSEPFTIVNAQFTYQFPNLEIYAGCENIFDFRQQRGIISWENPFGPYFDTNSVWGPTRGREAYIGIRYYLRSDVNDTE